MTIKAKAGQSLIDLAIEHYGDPAMAMTIAIANDTELTEELTPGATFWAPNK